ncbi:MAG TPA: DedA family protein [Candidatus Eremiobacteraceae bacterium]|nr:DedA family protein [Candidatus Eremiobacteraceae bacterium]
MHVLEAVSQFVLDLITRLGYTGLFAGMFGQAVGVPLPSELMMGFGGYLAFAHTFNFLAVVLVGTGGDTLGAVVAYWIGYYGGRPLLTRFGRFFFIAQRELAAADAWFARFGSRAVLICKLLPGIRAFGSYPAGVTRMNFGVFLGYTAMGSAAFCTLFAEAGYHLGKHWDLIIEQIKPISIVLLAALAIGIAIWLVVRARMEKAGGSSAA